MKKFIATFLLATTFVFSAATQAETTKHETGNFLLLSDIHFYPYASCQANTVCPAVEELRKAPVESWKDVLVKYGDAMPTVYGEDSGPTLIDSALNYAHMLLVGDNKSYDFIVVTGDLLGHDYMDKFNQFSSDTSPEAYQAFTKKTFEYVSQHISESTHSNQPIFMMLGNNDSYKGSYNVDLSGAFYSDMKALWGQYMGDDANKAAFDKTFGYAGYYEVQPNGNSKGRLIAINSIPPTIKGLSKNPETAVKAADDQLAWLEQRLADAKQSGAHVLLAYHVPTGVDTFATANSADKKTVILWSEDYNQRYTDLLKKYRDTVTAVIAAHFHSDSFQLLELGDTPSIVNMFAPSISPVYGENPSFKVVTYDKETLEPLNFKTYTYIINTDTPEWIKEYDFNETYQPQCTENCSLRSGYLNVHPEGAGAESYIKYFDGGHNSQPITDGAWMPYYWCATQHQTQKAFEACVAGV